MVQNVQTFGVKEIEAGLRALDNRPQLDARTMAAIITDNTGKYTDAQKLDAWNSNIDRTGYSRDELTAIVKDINASDFMKKLNAANQAVSNAFGQLEAKRQSDPNFTQTDYSLGAADFYNGLSDPFQRLALNADQNFALHIVAAALTKAGAEETQRIMGGDGILDFKDLAQARKAFESGLELYRAKKSSTPQDTVVINGKSVFGQASDAARSSFSSIKDIVSLSVAARAIKG